MADVVVFGSINADLVLRVDALPRPGETVAATRESHFGGKGANLAIAAAVCGASTRLVGAVGNDTDGASLLENLRRFEIDLDFIEVLDDAPTGLAAIPVDERGENSVIYAAGANLQLRPSLERAREAISGAKVVAAMLEIPASTIAVIAEAAWLEHVPFVLNLAPVVALDAKTLKRVTTLVVNEHEATALSHVYDSDSLLELGPKNLIVTLGSSGAAVYAGARRTIIPAPTVTAVDTTGAGDAFTGAFCAHIAKGADVADAAREAVTVASQKVRFRGAQLPLNFHA